MALPLAVCNASAKGWKLPANTVCVDRTTKWAIRPCRDPEYWDRQDSEGRLDNGFRQCGAPVVERPSPDFTFTPGSGHAERCRIERGYRMDFFGASFMKLFYEGKCRHSSAGRAADL
jgi:hypothetical protein